MENVIEFERAATEPLSDKDILDLFAGLFRLVRRQYQTQIDKLKKEVETLKQAQRSAPTRVMCPHAKVPLRTR